MSSSQAFEILCPVCRSVVPPEARGCPTCAERRRAELEGPALPEPPREQAGAVTSRPPVQAGVPVAAPDLTALSMKDYHRVVRATYHVNEGPPTASSRARAYLPFALLVVLLVLGAAVIFGHLP